jgi:ligand-binding sensor domain-containing protein
MKASSISGTLFAYDNTFHKSVSVQAVRIDKSTGQQQVVATTLSNETGNYRFTHLKPGRYLVRCYTGNYVYYAQSERATDEAVGDILLVEARKALEEIDFQFAPFKKGVWRTHNYLDGLASDRVYAIASDATEAMWFGTHDGVSRYDGRSFVNFTRRDELAGNQITSIHRNDDALWFGTFGGGISRYDGREFVSFTQEDGLADNFVYALCRDSAGDLWIGTRGGVSRYDGRTFVNITTEDGLVGNEIRTIHEGAEGIMWFGTSSGLTRYQPSSIPPVVRVISVQADDRYTDLKKIPSITQGLQGGYSTAGEAFSQNVHLRNGYGTAGSKF